MKESVRISFPKLNFRKEINMGMSKGRSQQTRVQRYNRKHPKAKFCNKRNIKKFRKRMTENALVLRSLAEVSPAA